MSPLTTKLYLAKSNLGHLPGHGAHGASVQAVDLLSVRPTVSTSDFIHRAFIYKHHQHTLVTLDTKNTEL